MEIALLFRSLSGLGKLIFQCWIALTFVCFFVIKDCFEIILWSSFKLKKRLVWISKSICGDSLWQTVTEEAQSYIDLQVIENFRSVLTRRGSVMNSISQTPQDPIARKSFLQQMRKKYEIHLCQNCRDMNASILQCAPLIPLTPMRANVSVSENVISYSNMQNTQMQQNSAAKSLKSNSCKLGKDSEFINDQNVSHSIDKQTVFIDQNELPKKLKRQNAIFNLTSLNNQEHEGVCGSFLKHHIAVCPFDMQKGQLETIPKQAFVRTPTHNSPCSNALRETPICDINSTPKIKRLQLRFVSDVEDTNVTSDQDTFLKSNWRKWKQFFKVNKSLKPKSGKNSIRLAMSDFKSTLMKKGDVDPHATEKDECVFELKGMQSPEVKSSCCNVCFKKKYESFRNNNETIVRYKRF